jgi:hypothetical protein
VVDIHRDGFAYTLIPNVEVLPGDGKGREGKVWPEETSRLVLSAVLHINLPVSLTYCGVCDTGTEGHLLLSAGE